MDLGVLEGQTRGGYFLDSIFDPSVNQCTGQSFPICVINILSVFCIIVASSPELGDMLGFAAACHGRGEASMTGWGSQETILGPGVRRAGVSGGQEARRPSGVRRPGRSGGGL